MEDLQEVARLILLQVDYNRECGKDDKFTKDEIADIINRRVIKFLPKKRIPWNKGKKKPITDDCGILWCNCDKPKLTSNAGGRGQALCLLCGTPWYH